MSESRAIRLRVLSASYNMNILNKLEYQMGLLIKITLHQLREIFFFFLTVNWLEKQ